MMPARPGPPGRAPIRWTPILTAVLVFVASAALAAQWQRKPPDFGGLYSFPTVTHPEPREYWVHLLDIIVLVVFLALGTWTILWRRSRKGVVLLSLGAVAYFGFYRKGCICPIGSIQNVVLTLVDPRYRISFGVVAFFFLPLGVTLLFGRIFCGSVCALGAIQDLVLIRPVTVPARLDRALGAIKYVYLGLAVLFAGWGLHLALGGWKIDIARRFIICEWDPFIGLFRLSGPFHMLAIGGAFVLGGMFIGRPYCRWLCPYGGLLALLSRVAWKNVSITPDKETDCGLCAGACPFGAIKQLRADRASCLACARCYASCPQELERRGLVPATVPVTPTETR